MIIQDNNAPDRQRAYNAEVPGIIARPYSQGYKIRAVDHSSIGGNLLADGLHPNDAGYSEMARIWFRALQNVPQDWITAPGQPLIGNSGSTQAETCARDALYWTPANSGNYIAAGAQVPGDTGVDTGPDGSGGSSTPPFQAYWDGIGNIALGLNRPGSGVEWEDLDGIIYAGMTT